MSDDVKIARIKSELKKLSYREREIIKLRYGLGDGYTYTQEEVGHVFKVTRERIRRIEKAAIAKLAASGVFDDPSLIEKAFRKKQVDK